MAPAKPPAAPLVPAPPPTFVLRGAVHNPLYQPISGALVEVVAPSGEGPPIARVRSDAKGNFAFAPLPAASVLVRTTAPGYGPSTLAVDLGASTQPLDVILATATSRYVVQVHAQRTTPPPTRSAESVAVVSRQTVDTLPGGDNASLTQVLATQPGFVADTFGALHARGAHGDLTFEIDGVPLPAAASAQFETAIPTRLVENLQILTGGLPAEYGWELAGVVDVTTRHGTPKPEGEVQIDYGSNQLIEPSAVWSQDFGTVSAFAGGSFQSTDRGLDTPAASPILHDQLLSGNGFARIDWLASPHDRIELIGNYTQNRYQIPIDPTVLPLSDAPPGATRGPDAYGNPPPTFVPYDANPTESERDTFATASWRHTFTGGSTLQVAPYADDSYGDLLCDPSGSLGPTADPGSTCSDVQREILHGGGVVNYSWTATHQDWKTGLRADFGHSAVGYTLFSRDDASPLGGPDPALTLGGQDQIDAAIAGVYLQDRITLGKWTIFPGVRLDAQDVAYLGTSLPPTVTVGPSARLGASYAFTEDLVLHAFGGYLWQPPTELDAPTAARILVPGLAGQTIPIDLQPEKDEYAEVGIADRFFRKLTASLTVWGRLAQDQLDEVNVGNTNLLAEYNFAHGRAAGVEAALDAVANKELTGFANVSWETGQGQGIESEKYLFPQSQVTDPSWQTLDHVQTWTANAGFDLHDAAEKSHLAVLFNYGSGLRTGANNDLTVPPHSTFDLTLRHRFDVVLHPELAVDVFNAFDEIYAIRIANGFVGSAYGPLRQFDVRLIVPFGG